MNEPSNCSSKIDETSDEDEKLRKLQITHKKIYTETESKEKNVGEIHRSKVNIPVSLSKFKKNNINDSEYLIHHAPKYTLPPHKDPKLANLSLRDQVKLICSYHTLISRSIANQAKIQIDSCSYPEPIEPIEPIQTKTVSSVQKKDDAENEETKDADGCSDKSDEYVSRSGRITKRKFYSEVDDHKKVRICKAKCSVPSTGNSSSKSMKKIKIAIEKNVGATKNYSEELALKILESSLQDTVTSPKGNGEEEVPTKRKAPTTPSRIRNVRQRQLKMESPEAEAENKKKNNSKLPPTSTIPKQQKRSSDGFVEPAVPGSNKRAARKTVECPICGKHFPEKEIEQHASSCGEIAMDVGNIDHLNITGFRCHSCKKVLISMEDYEIHCTTCNGGPSFLN